MTIGTHQLKFGPVPVTRITVIQGQKHDIIQVALDAPSPLFDGQHAGFSTTTRGGTGAQWVRETFHREPDAVLR